MQSNLLIAIFFLLPVCCLKAQNKVDSSFRFYYYDQKLSMFQDNTTVNADAIFTGDSITDGGEWAEFFPKKRVLNRGISADNTFGLLNRVDELIARQPKHLFILIGINDLAKNTPPAIILDNLKKTVQRIQIGSPKTVIVLQTLLPTNEAFADFPKHQNKTEEIALVNAGLKDLAAASGSELLDLHTAFKDADGKLDARYTNDGLHLMGAGYQLWIRLIKEKMKW